jgi:hypothetical protein
MFTVAKLAGEKVWAIREYSAVAVTDSNFLIWCVKKGGTSASIGGSEVSIMSSTVGEERSRVSRGVAVLVLRHDLGREDRRELRRRI